MFLGIRIRRLLITMSIIISILIVCQCYVYPYAILSFRFRPTDVLSSDNITLQHVTSLNHSEISVFHQVHSTDTVTHASYTKEKSDFNAEKKGETGLDLALDASQSVGFDKNVAFDGSLVMPNVNLTVDNRTKKLNGLNYYPPSIFGNSRRRVDTAEARSRLDSKSRNRVSTSSNQSQEISRNNTISTLKILKMPAISLSQMNTLLSLSHNSSCLKKPQCRWSSPRDRELLYARLEIEKAHAELNSQGITASVFRNPSMFKRSYELMEQMLKVYIYKEGEKPIFHRPVMRGIYASEGWFMKLIKENKKFVVKYPKKAHLFYLPFSSKLLRQALLGQNFHNSNDLEKYLKNYIDLIGRKYRFWNRTGGSDHFLVACHDWASRLTSQHMKNCIRALCNANAARGFEIGKDTSLPVTYIHLTNDTTASIRLKPPSERTTLAFFAGGIHGYLRPILLHFWENRESDMKIFGPMSRDIEGKRAYREHMRNSKYCICARGYQVHTPRVVEAILNECVPVLISDNYVPPFFEILNWESFSVFVEEKEIRNLRNILLSISETDYLAMHARLKMVQRHFIWHKQPEKFDLFHMILHSLWYNRVFQMKMKKN